MIEANKWYRFSNPDDRDLFITLAMIEFEFPSRQLSREVKAAQMLRVNTKDKDYPYFNYRTTYNSEYNGNVTLFSAAASIKDAGIKEVNMCDKGCVGPCGVPGPKGDMVDKLMVNSLYGAMGAPFKVANDPMVDIFDRWTHDKRAESRKQFEDELNNLLLDSTVGRSLKTFILTAQVYDKEFTMDPSSILRPSMLSVVELGDVEKLKKAYQSDCDVFEKEAFVTRNLLMAAETYEQKHDILKSKGVIK